MSNATALATLHRWATRGLFHRNPPAKCRGEALHRQMGMRVGVRMVRYRGINSTQCVMLPVSEATGWIKDRKISRWPTKRKRR